MNDKKIMAMLRENKCLSPAARTLWDIQHMNRKTWVAETASNLQFDIYKRVMKGVEKSNDLRAQVVDADSLVSYQNYVRETFINSLGGLPETEAPLNAQILDIVEYDNYFLEKIIYESRPKTYVTGNLYRPLQQKEQPGPAVFLVAGHANEGKGYEQYHTLAQMLVYAGFVVFMMDPFGQGERFEHYESELDLQPIQGCSGEHDMMDWKCKLLGLSLARYFLHDGIRGLEYLASRPEVDPTRIAVTGNSGGGTQTTMLMTAAAEKIAAAAPCSYTTDEQAMVECEKDMDNEMMWPGVLAAGLDFPDMIGAFAPKPVLLLTNRYDFFPKEGTDRTYKKICELWEKVGSADKPEIARSYTEHCYSKSLHEAVTKFFSRHLMGKEADVSGFVARNVSQSDLWCTSDGCVLKDYPDACTIQMELEKEYQEILQKRAETPWEEIKEKGKQWLRETVFADRKEEPVNVRVSGEGICCPYVFRNLVWRAQENYWGMGVLLRDMRFGNKPLPTIVALWPDGCKAIELHSTWIYKQCSEGKQVLIADLAASGALEPNPLSGTGLRTGWSTMFICNGFLIKLGDSLAATRIYQAIRALEVVKELPQEYSGEISYYGEGEFARYAKMASLLSGVPVEATGMYQNYSEVVNGKYYDQTHTLDWEIPGILRYLDMDDIDRCLKEEGLMN